MGRGRKGKKQNLSTTREDTGSGEEEKIPTARRRGRPQKTVKDDTKLEEEEALEMEENDNHTFGTLSDNDMKNPADTESGKKRKRPAQVKEIIDSVKEENGVGLKSSTDASRKSAGFRQNGNRRKNKPRRAAEAVVECQ